MAGFKDFFIEMQKYRFLWYGHTDENRAAMFLC